MGDESLNTIKMGVAFAFFVAVLFYVIFNTRFGRALLSVTVEEIEDATDSVTYKNFAEFTGEGMVVPAAAAYAFIGYNENSIASITCYVHGSNPAYTGYGMDDTCLKNHLKGYVRMQAAYNEAEGDYFLYLREADK